MRHLLSIIIFTAVLLLVGSAWSCTRHSAAWDTLARVDSIIEIDPDSAYTMLLGIDRAALAGDEERARYALLMSMALDKNYIDTTGFEVLQPAIDYYASHGTPDDKLRTLYYRGVVFLNRGDDENAMSTFLRARKLEAVTDSLVRARLYISLAMLYFRQFMIKDFIYLSSQAAKIYESFGDYRKAANSYAKALNGAVSRRDTALADSLYARCQDDVFRDFRQKPPLVASIISYDLVFGDDTAARDCIARFEDGPLDQDLAYQLANAHVTLGNGQKAIEMLERFAPRTTLDSLTYLMRKSRAYESMGDIPKAYETFKLFDYLVGKYQSDITEHSIFTIEAEHKADLSLLAEKREKENLKMKMLLFALSCIILISGLCYMYYINKTKRALSEKENEILKLEREAAEQKIKTLAMQRSQLEDEYADLKNMLMHNPGLSEPVLDSVRKRMDVLNDLFVKEISKSEKLTGKYGDCISCLIENRDEFLLSTRLSFKATAPKFMERLESCGLTDDEINISCLLAMGLSGKEAGNYVSSKSYYNISSAIRKKLGVPDNGSHLGAYLRRLASSDR